MSHGRDVSLQGPAGLPRGRRCLAALVALAAALAWPACGKKGPPLAPLITVPAAVEGFAARRQGPVVYLRFTVPSTNRDGSRPADLARVDVYGYTGNPGSNAEFLKNATLVASVPIRRPRPPEESTPPPEGAQAGAPPRPARPPAEPGVEQGAVVTLTEPVTPAVLAPVVPAPAGPGRVVVPPEPPVPAPLWSADATPVPARIYVAVGVSRKGRRGAFSPRLAVPLVPPGGAPVDVRATFTERDIELTWAAPADARRPVQGPEAGEGLPSKPVVGATSGSRYNVYAAPPPAPGGTAVPPGGLPSVEMPVPLNGQPLEALSFEDPRLEFGTERCYVVRTVDVYGTLQWEGPPSPVTCVTPVDVFPPAAPTGLAAVATAGAINLIWEPNSEPDLAGYQVLRAEGDGPLRPITTAPVTETTFRDATVRPGVRYVYAVVAVDTATPPNVSPASNTAEDIAR